MITASCSFETDRLVVRPWHHPPGNGWPPLDLSATVADLLTEPVTRHLPPAWAGPYSIDRARRWIVERDGESPTLLAVEQATGEAVGLVILFEAPIGSDDLVSVRLGYLVGQPAWGRGLATELVGGVVDWCRSQPRLGSIVGGVAPANQGSRRVLEHLGFTLLPPPPEAAEDAELLYQLDLPADPQGGEGR